MRPPLLVVLPLLTACAAPEARPPERTTQATTQGAPSSCRHARRERATLAARGLGPNHPDMRAVDAKLQTCSASELAASPRECEDLRRERAGLIAGGKGERHPEVVAVDEQLHDCQPVP